MAGDFRVGKNNGWCIDSMEYDRCESDLNCCLHCLMVSSFGLLHFLKNSGSLLLCLSWRLRVPVILDLVPKASSAVWIGCSVALFCILITIPTAIKGHGTSWDSTLSMWIRNMKAIFINAHLQQFSNKLGSSQPHTTLTFTLWTLCCHTQWQNTGVNGVTPACLSCAVPNPKCCRCCLEEHMSSCIV